MIYINRFIALVIFIGLIIPFSVVGFIVSAGLEPVQHLLYPLYSFIKNGEFSMLKRDDCLNNRFTKLMNIVEDLHERLREKKML